ncbi:hypothetical protein [Streptomyces sp. NPDC016845]|uniref:hypothetical protein n=1 Tax=Streptomyces sp. NPDC016845 TaxID=3364972 RepID=UPI0037966A7A
MTVTWRELGAHGARTLPVRVLGVALVVVAGRPWETVHGLLRAVLFGGVVLFAVWAAPGVDRRPTAASSRWLDQVVRHRTTVLAGVGVSLAAVGGGVSGWQGLCAAVLLAGYLVAGDAWSTGGTAQRGPGRVWGEGAAAVVAAGLVWGSATISGGRWGDGRTGAVGVLVVGLAVVVGGGWWMLSGARRAQAGRPGLRRQAPHHARGEAQRGEGTSRQGGGGGA